MQRQTTQRLILSLVWLVASLAGAQEDTSEAAVEPRYHVEVLVFRHADASRTTRETGRPRLDGFGKTLEERLAEIASEPSAGARAALEWQPLDPGRRALTAEAETLRRLQAYELLAHLAWTQPAPPESAAVALPLRAVLRDTSRIDGDIRLYMRRFLHLALDLRLRDGSVAGDPGGGFGGPAAVLRDSRRIRPKRLVYFDRPEFGVLAMVRAAD